MTLDLSTYKPVPSATGDANQIANGFTALETFLNATLPASLISYQAGANVSAGNTDLAWSGAALETFIVITTGGGTLRSLGAPTLGAGARVSIRNGSAANITILQANVAGAGKALYTPTSVDMVLAPTETVEFIYDGTEWIHVAVSQAKISTFVPVWGSTGVAPAIGNGTVTALWTRHGSLNVFVIQLAMGSTTTFGTGAWKFSTPFALAGPVFLATPGEAFDSSANARYPLGAITLDTTHIEPLVWAVAGGFIAVSGALDNATPFVWAVGDVLTIGAIGWNT